MFCNFHHALLSWLLFYVYFWSTNIFSDCIGAIKQHTAAEPENGTTAFSSFSAGALTTNQRPRFHPRDFPSSQWRPAIQSRGSRPNTAECRGWAHWTCPCPAQTWDGEIYVKHTRFCMEFSSRCDRRCLTFLIPQHWCNADLDIGQQLTPAASDAAVVSDWEENLAGWEWREISTKSGDLLSVELCWAPHWLCLRRQWNLKKFHNGWNKPPGTAEISEKRGVSVNMRD